MSDCEKNKEVFVSLKPYLPIRQKPFQFEIGYDGSRNVPGKICIRGEINKWKRCLIELKEKHAYYRPLWIKIIAICPTIKNLETRNSSLEVKFHTQYLHDKSNEFWSSYMFPSIKVTDYMKCSLY